MSGGSRLYVVAARLDFDGNNDASGIFAASARCCSRSFAAKLEIHRSALGKPLLSPGDPHILGVATDAPDQLRTALPVFGLNDVEDIATFICDHASAWRVAD